jgi:predicted DNA-binding transcriptional regulator AlpA
MCRLAKIHSVVLLHLTGNAWSTRRRYPMTERNTRVETQLLRMREVSALTTVPVETLRFWRQKGEGPRSFKLGKNVVYLASDVEAWIEAQRAVS